MRKWMLMASLCGSLALAAGCSDDGDDGNGDTSATTTTDTSATTTTDTSATTTSGTDATESDTTEQVVIHDCTEFTDGTLDGQSRTIAFGSPGPGLAYAPSCLRINAGQEVTWSGNLGGHPLDPGVAPNRTDDPAGSPNNPIQSTDTGDSVSFTFPTAGIYPYHCGFHFGAGMIGVILVE